MTYILSQKPLGFHWPTQDPFLFCAHHQDFYPKGNTQLGPIESLDGRQLGSDFDLSNPWKMYHGRQVPGFPVHPHRGFETVTIVLEGFVDHFDSGGGSGRYGQGDVQWMTAGAGLQHAEMFPLLSQEEDNPLHLFQVWLNLPAKNKFVPPFYKMLWHEDIPVVKTAHESGKVSEVKVIAGTFRDMKAPLPAPDSWAADPHNGVRIWIIRIAEGETLTLPSASKTVLRSLYHYRGGGVGVGESELIPCETMVSLSTESVDLVAKDVDAYLLLLEAEPISEPVSQYGPFVMNTREEISQAYADYEKTQFGGWPWRRSDPTHPIQVGRMAIYSDGTKSLPPE
jgi:hypothetical protein